MFTTIVPAAGWLGFGVVGDGSPDGGGRLITRTQTRDGGRPSAEPRDPSDHLLHLLQGAEDGLRQPLRHIRQAMAWLEEQLWWAVPGATVDHLEVITEAADKLEATTEGLLTFSRACSATPSIAQVDMKAVTDVAAMLTRTRFPSVDLVFVVGPMTTVLGDADLLLVAIQELLANAVEYRRQPDVAVVTVSARVTGGQAVVRVADQGTGVDPRYHESIFEPLRHLHQRGEHRGVGMGLAIARAVAASHDGTLVLESSTPDGSVFTMAWPQVISLVSEPAAG
jgi:light-regulated signal transduction histidine kinase (bacteriophytochrome)